MELEHRLYHKYANFFELRYEQGKLFELDEELGEVQREDTVYFGGRLYTYDESAENIVEIEPSLLLLKSVITKQFCIGLKENGYRFKGRCLSFREEDIIDQPHTDIFNMFNGFRFRTIALFGRLFLCIDPHLIILIETSIDYLLSQGVAPDRLCDFSVRYRSQEGKRIDGYLIETSQGNAFDSRFGSDFLCKVKSYREFEEQIIPPSHVYPESRPELIQRILDNLNRRFSVISLQRQHSFLNSRTASKERLKRTLKIIRQLQEIFPLKFGEFKVILENEPVRIKW